MRNVSIRQFRHNMAKELADMPFTITRRGNIVAIVDVYTNGPSVHNKPSSVHNEVYTKPDDVYTTDTTTHKLKSIAQDRGLKLCKHGNVASLCKECIVSKK